MCFKTAPPPTRDEYEVKELFHNEQVKGNHFVFMKYHRDQDAPQNIALSTITSSASVTIIWARNKAAAGAPFYATFWALKKWQTHRCSAVKIKAFFY
jgi:hypothetical protein